MTALIEHHVVVARESRDGGADLGVVQFHHVRHERSEEELVAAPGGVAQTVVQPFRIGVPAHVAVGGVDLPALLLAGGGCLGLVPKVVGQHGVVGHEHDAAGHGDLPVFASVGGRLLVEGRLARVINADDQTGFAFTQGGVVFTTANINGSRG